MAEREHKKRKRQSNGVDVPRKRTAVDAIPLEKIMVEYHGNVDISPVLATAPGLSTPSIKFNAYQKTRSSGAQAGQSHPATQQLLLHSRQHPQLDYTASAVEHGQDLAHYVAIYDPNDNKVHITPAHHLHVRSTVRRQAERESPNKPRGTLRQQRDELGLEFGTKAAKKALADRTMNAIKKDDERNGKKNDVETAILESMADTAYTEVKKVQEAEMFASRPIPKPNLEAENIEDIYPLDILIPPADGWLVPVKDWQENARAEIPMSFAHAFPANRVAAIGKSDMTDRLKALRYLHLLLEFHDVLGNAGKSGKKVPKRDTLRRELAEWPDALVDSVVRRFSNAQFELPRWNLDYLYTHICALSLYVDGYMTDTADLRFDLKMENKQMTLYMRELGCKVAGPTKHEAESKKLTNAQVVATKIAKLRLPLDLPKPKLRRRK